MFAGFVAGIGLIGGGYTFSNKLKHFADVIIGGGALVLYSTFLYAARYPEVGVKEFQNPEIVSLAVGFVFAAIIAFYSVQRKSKYILGLGMLAGYITPFVLAYFGNLLDFADNKSGLFYNSSFITFFLYFIAVNLTALYASTKLSLKSFGFLNSPGLFIGSIALLVMTEDGFTDNAVFTVLVSAGVVALHVGFMALNAKTFKNQNHPYLYLGYLLPLGWFSFIINNLINLDKVEYLAGVGLYIFIAFVYFGAWYYLRNLTKSDKHFGLYIGGVVSLVIGAMLLAPDLNEYQGLVGSFAAIIFAGLYIQKPIIQRFVSFVVFAVFGLLMTQVNLGSADGHIIGLEVQSFLLSLSLAPFTLALFFNKKEPKELEGAVSLSRFASLFSALGIILIIGKDFVENSGIAKDFLFLTVPAAIIAIYLILAKDVKQRVVLIISSIALGLCGYFLSGYKFLEAMNPGNTHTDNLFATEKSWIGLVTLLVFGALYFQTKKHKKEVGDGVRFLSIFAPVIVLIQLASNEIIALYNTLGINSSEGKTDGIMALTMSIFWALLASFLIYLGLNNSERNLEKNIGFGVLALTVLKIFVYDLAEADNTLKVMLLIVVGSLILGVSYFSNLKKDDNSDK